jgi:hypothetical protein
MDVDTITGPLLLNVLTMRNDLPQSFKIKVTQIKKGSPLEAPKNCFSTTEEFKVQSSPSTTR